MILPTPSARKGFHRQFRWPILPLCGKKQDRARQILAMPELRRRRTGLRFLNDLEPVIGVERSSSMADGRARDRRKLSELAECIHLPRTHRYLYEGL